jgi:hypothetical protein
VPLVCSRLQAIFCLLLCGCFCRVVVASGVEPRILGAGVSACKALVRSRPHGGHQYCYHGVCPRSSGSCL